MTEREICEWMYARVKEGRKRYKTGEQCPHRADTVIGLLDLLGWCSEDFRAALMRHDPVYRVEQERFEREGVYS
jgi:hypothetical protein